MVCKKIIFGFVLGISVVRSALSIGLVEAYEAALVHDATYRTARYENLAGQESAALGRANLLPNISVNYSGSKNRADLTSKDFLGRSNATHPDYTSTAAAVSLRQPIINFDGLARYQQGMAQTQYADAVFSIREEELILRVVGAYTDVHYAEDQLALSRAQREAFVEQKRLNDRLFEKGEGTRTDMLETQAKVDVAEAQVLEAEDNLANARATLAAMIGKEVAAVDGLTEPFMLKPVQPQNFTEWQIIALEKNADVRAQRYAVESAQHEVSKSRAGHMPRLDFVASYSKNDSETINTFNQESTVRSLGIQLTIPIYAGGSVDAQLRQSIANHERAKADLAAKSDKAVVELRKQFNAVVSSSTKIPALEKTVRSTQLLIEATKQSVKGGMRINADVLNAQQQYYAAKRDLAQARYGYLQAYLRLRYEAGVLHQTDVQEIAAYFKGVKE